MNLYSSLFDPIPIVRNSVNMILFEDANRQFMMRELLMKWSKNEQMDHPYLIFTVDDLDVSANDVNLLTFHSGDLQFFKEKEQQKQLAQLIKFEIERDEQLIRRYDELLHYMEASFQSLSIGFDHYDIELTTENVTFEQLLKLASIEVSYRDEQLHKISDYRKFLIQTSLRLNYNKKTNVCFYNFPENELKRNEFLDIFRDVEAQQLTVICITSNSKWVEYVPLSNIHLIKEDGTRYEIESLYEQVMLFQTELQIFDDFDASEDLSKKLAVHDFFRDVSLLERKWREFLESNEF